MRKSRIALQAIIGSGILTVGLAGPSYANDASLSTYGSSASYTDLTDNLCTNATNDTQWRDYSIAQIVNSGGSVVFSVADSQGGGNTCTGNLPIPEDVLYTLRLTDCQDIAGSPCSPFVSTQFYS